MTHWSYTNAHVIGKAKNRAPLSDLTLGNSSPGVSAWHKFGTNTDVGTNEEDIWLTGGKETLPTSGVTMYVSCTDNTNGVGQTIEVIGLDENWDFASEEVVLTGQTQAAIPGSWTRIFRAFQTSAEPDPVGDVYVAESDTLTLGVPDTASKIHALVDFTNAAQQTEKAMFTVPAGHKGIILEFNGVMLNASGTSRSATVALEVQELAEGATVANPSWAPWRRIDQHGILSDGSSEFHERWSLAQGPFGQLTNIHIRATATASSNIKSDMTLVIWKDD